MRNALLVKVSLVEFTEVIFLMASSWLSRGLTWKIYHCQNKMS
uniref:Uncharacterized protein n=1 Tax=Arundo donax TaxID=35708 RepID=A0A0A9CIU2_ARUDO